MRTLIDPNSSCGFCGGYDLGTRCESCGAGSDNYDATSGEQGWIMKSKLNELRLNAGIARIENQQWLCVLDKETGMMIDPMIGLEKFAQLIVRECVGVVEGGSFLHDQAPTAVFARECSGAIKRHFGEDSSIRVGGRVKVVLGFNVGAQGTVSYIEPTGRLWVRRDGASTDVFYTPNEVVGIAQ